MMARPAILESFDDGADAAGPAPPDPPPPEEPVLGYEDGFRTGREAGRAEILEQTARIEADLARRFAEIAFTHAEARASLLDSLRPLFQAVTGTLLPEMARASLGPYVVEALMEAAEADTRAPVALLVSPEVHDTVRGIAERQAGNPVVVDANTGLGPGEVLIRGADRETILDLDQLVSDLRTSLEAVFIEDDRSARHG